MRSFETKLIDYIKKNKEILFFVIMLLINFYMRYHLRGYVSGDFSASLLPWYQEIASMSVKEALTTQVGDYNIPYQTIILILTRIPQLMPITAYKIVSVFFDFILAYAGAKIVMLITGEKKYFLITYILIMFVPTVVLNSTAWGQADAIYSAFALLSIMSLLQEKYRNAFIFLGCSFAFKLQAVMILPLFIFMWSQKKYSLLNLIWIPIVLYIICLPALIVGRGIFEPIQVYLAQSGEYPFMSMNIINFWSLFANEEIFTYSVLKTFAVVMTLAIYGFAFLSLLNSKYDSSFNNKEFILKLAAWTAWTAPLFLPAMHDRYFYLADLLLVLIAFITKDKLYISSAVFSVGCSLLMYNRYLYATDVQIVVQNLLSVCQISLYILFTRSVFMIESKEER